MLDKNLPLTREVYMGIAGMPLEMGPELEQMLPRPFRLPNPDA